ncbi:MAG: GNAT family N-acetyltransferase [Lachnospiraceae bacterium]|nr:GNAT family N-acetyltransferase [Lachnospiraceae bacterium]
MVLEEKKVTLKDGRSAVLRNIRMEDAADLITYLKVTAAETPFLIREPEEIRITPEREQAFIQSKIDAKRELGLIARVDGRHAGNCSLMSLGPFGRYAHRCSIAIALYQEFCGLGLGEAMLQTILDVAKECGYEQAELEVVSNNERAKHLYEKLGFKVYGERPHSMKYKDGTYAGEYLMVKEL